MRRSWVAVLVLVAVWAVALVAVAQATGTEDPTSSMVWVATFVAGIVAMPIIQFLKVLLDKLLGEALSSRLMAYTAWGISYGIAAVVFIIFGGWPVVANQGFMIFTVGSTVGKLAEMVYKTIPTVGGKSLSRSGWTK